MRHMGLKGDIGYEARRDENGARHEGCLRISVENLPSDMSQMELRSAAEPLAKVIDVKIWEADDGSKSGIIDYDESANSAHVLRKLNNRRVEGWDRRLRAYVVDQERARGQRRTSNQKGGSGADKVSEYEPRGRRR